MGLQANSYAPVPSRERLLVSFLPDASVNPDAFFSARGVRKLEYIAGIDTYLVELPEGANVLTIMSSIAGAPGIKFVEQDATRYTDTVWDGNNTQPLTPAPSSPVLQATSTTLGVLFMLAAVAWALRSL